MYFFNGYILYLWKQTVKNPSELPYCCQYFTIKKFFEKKNKQQNTVKPKNLIV